jgi:hypothetical protein
MKTECQFSLLGFLRCQKFSQQFLNQVIFRTPPAVAVDREGHCFDRVCLDIEQKHEGKREQEYRRLSAPLK